MRRKRASGRMMYKELKEVFSVLGKEVPNLLRGLIDPLKELLNMIYDPEKTRES
ncbi:MAG: hypothetical protein NZ992_02125 [Candidatus Korarchaeum sp.]|nr:hypothetical protein [Candidatus Korarchaeum sp.]MDW8036201.1 hypothetical protein [Candidatus Korarchaeum sp.]